jgi:hypothetical protein
MRPSAGILLRVLLNATLRKTNAAMELAGRLLNMIRTIALVAKPCQRAFDSRAHGMVNLNRMRGFKMKNAARD